MIKTLLTFLLLCHIIACYGQGLSPERVNKIKDATLRISMDSSGATGTGFYFNTYGYIATCWHVIAPAIVSTDGKTFNLRKIYVENRLGEKMEATVMPGLIEKYGQSANFYDICILKVVSPMKFGFPFLKIGSFNNLKEGQEVYSCGYPLSLKEQFLSKGIVSTKFSDSSFYIAQPTGKGDTLKFFRPQALLDLTLNPGNSGGAVLLFGESPDNDDVIGLADFIINPISVSRDKAESFYRNAQIMSGALFMGANGASIDPAAMNVYLIDILRAMSVGISGCVAINPISEIYKLLGGR